MTTTPPLEQVPPPPSSVLPAPSVRLMAGLSTVGAPGFAATGGAPVFNVQPSLNALPGGQVLTNLMNGLSAWALALSLVGLLIGAAAWALGSHGQNYQQTFVGRRAVLISGLSALLIGAGPALVHFFYQAGQGVQ